MKRYVLACFILFLHSKTLFTKNIQIYSLYASLSCVQIGSVDEESSKSDEEYDDLALQDVRENGYWSDDDEESRDRYRQNLELFLSTRTEQLAEPLCSYASLLREKGERRVLNSGSLKIRKRSLSIPAIRKHEPTVGDPILSGAPPR